MKKSIRLLLLLFACVLCLQSCSLPNSTPKRSGKVIENATPLSTISSVGGRLGDVNGDGDITNEDVLLIYRYIYNPDLYPLNNKIADVNQDGSVTNEDVLLIFRYIYNPDLYPIVGEVSPHSYTKTSTVAPTSVKDGYSVYTCSHCGESYQGDYIPAKGTQGLTYTVNEDGITCTVTGMSSGNTDKELLIPEYLNGYKVTKIGYEAFKKNKNIKTVYLPDTVTHIEHAAFSECSNLYEIQFPASLEYIGTWAFNSSSITTDFIVPKSLTYLGANSFDHCPALSDVYYLGSEEEWNANINIGTGNDVFVNAKRHYNHGADIIEENYIIEKSTKINVDAVKDDSYVTKIDIDQRVYPSKEKETTGNGRATAWVTNTTYGLYIYAEVKDSTVTTTSGNDGDLFQVYLDFINNHGELGLGGNDYRDTVATAKSKTLGWINVKPDGTYTAAWGFSGVSGIKSAAKTITGGYAIELYVPFSKANNGGKELGLSFEVKDDVDGDGTLESAYSNHPIGNLFYAYYDRLPDYTLRINYKKAPTEIEYTKVNIGLDGYKDAAYRTRVNIDSPWSANPKNSVGNGIAWISQDNNGLYFYIDVIDHNVYNNTDNSVTDGDRVQIYLDFKNNHSELGVTGSSYISTKDTGGYLGYITVSPDGEIFTQHNFANLVGIKAATRRTDSGYAVELYVPFNSAAAETIGIGFEIHNDTDGKLSAEGKHNREAIFTDIEGGTNYWSNYDLLPDYTIEEAPLLTSFCFTDVHNNFAMLEPTNSMGDYIIRGTATLAIEQILATEGKVDVTVIGGDYMSDYPAWDESSGVGKLPYKYFLGYKAKTIETFAKLSEGGKFIYVGGNHDYAQGEDSGLGGPGKNGTYNSTDFYSGDGMEKVMGKLSADDMFTKVGTNTGLTYILAYYYEVDGIGFAGLAPDPDIIWHKQGDGMSDEALAWLDAKLDEVDPDGTKVIFLNCHYVINGRNTASNTSTSDYHKEKFTPVFLGHNNLFHLYGHWESNSDDYTCINLFHYDKNGKLIDGARNEVDSNNVILAKDRGFNAVYMGHFRPMYNSQPDLFYDDTLYGYGGYSTYQKQHGSTLTPKIAQGMYIEVYEDRIVFTMKNFGIIPGFETGTESVPYTVYLNK